MALKSFSKFYYGHRVTDENCYIDFDEGNGPLVATLNPGSYTLTEFVNEIARAMGNAGLQDYSASLDRKTRQVTISATDNFTLLFNSGSNKSYGAIGLIGFTSDNDLTGANSYQSPNGSGGEFKPQMWLQKYTPFENFQESIGATKSTSSSGVVEIVTFGEIRKMECVISHATNKPIGFLAQWEQDLSGVENFRSFLHDACVKGGRLEFMPDRDDEDNFYKCILESSPGYKEGTGFKLTELFSQKLPDFFKFGPLVFREVK
ncbi:hypothetical protein [Kangiella sp.]|uniref:hypothetical protein n=1 Tax=Kangiella sp. TaxID=1920245 RepID=UPI003A907FB4